MAESWVPHLFAKPPGLQWEPAHQYLYSLLWSAFLDLDAYSASRFRRRFFPYSTHFVVRELMPQNGTVQQLVGGRCSRLDPDRDRLDEHFRDLALWTVIPKLLGPSPYRDRTAPASNRAGFTEAEVALGLGREVSKYLLDACGVDVASFRLGAESRPIVPPTLGLGIGDAKFDITSGRRTAKARLSAVVQVPYRRETVARLTDPLTWRAFTYWEPPDSPSNDASKKSGTLLMKLLLPGGNRPDLSKWRELSFSYGSAITPFEARIDYEGAETADPEAMLPDVTALEADRAFNPNAEVTEQADPQPPWQEDFPHVRAINGFLSFQKVEARPLWTRFVAEREVRFESPNHDRFRVETLMFWLTCDLVSFAMQFRPPATASTNGQS